MAQNKVVNVGFRRYQVLNVTATTTEEEYEFYLLGLSEIVIINNIGSDDVEVAFGHITNDRILVKANEERQIPIKTNKIYIKAKNTTSDVEIIGFTI